MVKNNIISIVSCYTVTVFLVGVTNVAGEITATQAQINAIRKNDATITIKKNTTPIAGAKVFVKQIRHHFGFGAALDYDFLFPDSGDGQKYQETFKKYFEWATPENSQKWPATDQKQGTQDYTKPDSVISWCSENDIQVRGHNLFWNQKMDWMPTWAQTLTGSNGKAAIDERINKCLTHYKGKCAHWDIINEIIHGEAGSDKKTGTLQVMTGDPNIYSYVLKEAAKIETESKFTLNDFNIVERWSDRDKYIAKVNDLINQGCKVDVLGCEGHFGTDFDINDFKMKLNDVSSKVDREIWLTEVDFINNNSVYVIEQLMDACFSHKKVGGIIIWAFWQGNLWRETLTSFVVDSNFRETAVGKIWREKIAAWTTVDSGTTDNNGKFTFNGYHGKYAVTIVNEKDTIHDTIYVAPGNTQDFPVAINQQKTSPVTNGKVVIDGREISFAIPVSVDNKVFLSAYSLSGKLLAKVPLSFYNRTGNAIKLPSGCHVYTIGTRQSLLFSGVGLQLE